MLSDIQIAQQTPCEPITEIAKKLNIGRSSLYRALDSLEKDGYIFKNGDEWEIAKGESS